MFTGIIGGTGLIAGFLRQGREARLTIQPRFHFDNIVDGESIAINGVCLSVEKHQGNAFSAYASEETLSRTNLSFLKAGSVVNLERALAFGERLGGHLVSGHVDCLAAVEKITALGESKKIRLNFPARFGPEVIEKGSVALDGISLTVNVAGPDFLEVNIIPDSFKRANISLWQPGWYVNMETDLIGKYVISAVRSLKTAEKPGGQSGIDRDFLGRYGFLF